MKIESGRISDESRRTPSRSGRITRLIPIESAGWRRRRPSACRLVVHGEGSIFAGHVNHRPRGQGDGDRPRRPIETADGVEGLKSQSVRTGGDSADIEAGNRLSGRNPKHGNRCLSAVDPNMRQVIHSDAQSRAGHATLSPHAAAQRQPKDGNDSKGL